MSITQSQISAAIRGHRGPVKLLASGYPYYGHDDGSRLVLRSSGLWARFEGMAIDIEAFSFDLIVRVPRGFKLVSQVLQPGDWMAFDLAELHSTHALFLRVHAASGVLHDPQFLAPLVDLIDPVAKAQ